MDELLDSCLRTEARFVDEPEPVHRFAKAFCGARHVV